MKKARLLAPRNMAREILSDTDAQRMLDSGSWVLAAIPKKQSAVAKRQREFWRRREAAGYKKLLLILPGHVVDELHVLQREGETMAELVERLMLYYNNSEKGKVRSQKVDP